MLKIVHITVCRRLSEGQRKQLRWESEGGGRISDANWATLAFHNGPIVEPFERRLPWLFRAAALRSLYGWIVARRLSRQYDYVLLRHMGYDIFAFLFAPLVPNRIGVHHAKEVEEMSLIRPGFDGKVAATVERIAGRFAVRRSAAILGVTREIAQYEREGRAPGKACGFYPNGIDLKSIVAAPDERSAARISIVFICGTFRPWHGLDRLIAAIAQAEDLPTELTIHLIGRLSEELKSQIAALGDRASKFQIHGHLEAAVYNKLLATADVGLGSLAMDRQRLHEGSTLKVREMLAMGLPVYSGHRDAALPDSFPFYAQHDAIDIATLCIFAGAMKNVSRDEIRKSAAPYIEKVSAMQGVVDWLRVDFPNSMKGFREPPPGR